jgi:hypothetical protein
MPEINCYTYVMQYQFVIIFSTQDSDAPLPKVFIEIGWPVAQWIVTIGGIFGLCARYVEWNGRNMADSCMLFLNILIFLLKANIVEWTFCLKWDVHRQ